MVLGFGYFYPFPQVRNLVFIVILVVCEDSQVFFCAFYLPKESELIFYSCFMFYILYFDILLYVLFVCFHSCGRVRFACACATVQPVHDCQSKCRMERSGFRESVPLNIYHEVINLLWLDAIIGLQDAVGIKRQPS